MSVQTGWAVDPDRNWTFKDARILPDGERFILNVAGMVVTDFELVEEAKQYHSDNFFTEGSLKFPTTILVELAAGKIGSVPLRLGILTFEHEHEDELVCDLEPSKAVKIGKNTERSSSQILPDGLKAKDLRVRE
jgi:hypothetical protein